MYDKKKLIIDSTLRDGEQAPGIVFPLNERKRIAEMIAASGVDEIEAGTPVMGNEDIEFLRWTRSINLPVSCWCRADRRDIEAAKKTGVAGIHISIPVSDRLLGIFNKDKDWVKKNLQECYKDCLADFDRITVGFMDASRTSYDYIESLTKLAGQIGYDRIRIADSAGIMAPSDVMKMIASLSKEEVNIEFHAHNDLGMATANAVTALECGASAVSGTFLGIGERAGNACIEEILFHHKLKNSSTRISMSEINTLCSYLSKITGRTIAHDKPVLGKNIFSHETGIHVTATLKDPLSFMPVNPVDIGLAAAVICTGRHSGSNSIKYVLSQRSIYIDKCQAEEILPEIRRKSVECGRDLEAGEVERIYHEYSGKRN